MMDKNGRLLFFTDPYPDELVYSVLARFHYYNCGLPYGSSQEKLFGSKRIIPNLYLVFNLDHLVDKLSEFYSSEKLRDNHTIYSFIAPFLKPDQKHFLNEAIFKGTNSQRAAGFSGLSNIYYYDNLKDIRYCPVCAREDLETYGEVYLHRLNHLPGIDICPRHFCYLQKYPLEYPENSFRQYVYIEPERLDLEEVPCGCESEIALAQSALEVIESDGLELDSLILRMEQFYRDRGYLKGRHFKTSKLYQDLLAYYGQDYLASKNCLLTPKQLLNYDGTFIDLHRSHRRKHFIPYQFLLVANFLSGSFKKFVNTPCPKQEILDSGLCCHNPAAGHYGEKVIKDFTIIDRSDHFDVIARCECGMIYSARSDDLSKVKILQYGTLFYDKVRELLQQGMSLNGVSQKLHVCTKTVRFIRDDNHPNRVDETVKDYRKRFLNIIESDPAITIDHFRTQDCYLYYYLSRYDKAWLDEHSKISYKRKKVSKDTLDKQLSEQAQRVVQNLKSISPPERITKRRILEKIGIEKSQLNQYPQTKAIIDKEAETFLEYYLREIGPIVERINQEGLIISQSLLHDYGFRHSFKTKNGKAVWSLLQQENGCLTKN